MERGREKCDRRRRAIPSSSLLLEKRGYPILACPPTDEKSNGFASNSTSSNRLAVHGKLLPWPTRSKNGRKNREGAQKGLIPVYGFESGHGGRQSVTRPGHSSLSFTICDWYFRGMRTRAVLQSRLPKPYANRRLTPEKKG